ncbi:MAG: trypsin-like peptidase domain-containing protein [Patescibacteria group bacterium]|jgi:serine protease Do
MRFKGYLGVATLIIFLVILVGFGGGVPQSLKIPFGNFLQKPSYGKPDSIRTTELVEEESSIVDVVEKVSPSVVSIVVKSVGFDIFSGPTISEEGIGTGFIVDPSGLIVTNSHVVNSVNGEYSVVLKDGTTHEVNKIHLDEPTDLAILEITARGLPVVEFGDSDILKVGQKAIAIGNALGRYQNTVTLGIVSGISRSLSASSGLGGAVKTYEGAIQTDAAINPGNSGGPLLNSAGQLIGINVATSYGADNISFAIPVNTLKPLLEGLLREGKIVRPYLGVDYTVVTSEIASLKELPEGAFVSRVIVDSPAEKVGLKRGDIIVRFEGKDINEDYPLSKAISETKVGDKVELVVDRQGDVVTFSPVLTDTPETL